MKTNLKAKDFLTLFSDVSTCTGDERLNTALSLNRSSSDPVFVVSAKGKLDGLISLKHALFEKRLPFTTKAKNALIIPPQINPETPLVVVARHMLSTGLLTLPVFDEEQNISGVVAAPSIFKLIVRKKLFVEEVIENMKVAKPDVARSTILVDEAYDQLRRSGASRLFLLDEHGKAVAIITIKDIEKVLASRRKNERFSIAVGTNGINTQVVEQGGMFKKSLPALDYASKSVISILASEGLGNALRRMLEHKLPSIILVDKYEKPKGVISTKTILEAITKTEEGVDIPLLFHHAPDGPTREYRLEQLNEILQKFGQKLNRRNPIQRIELTIEQPKNAVGKVTSYDVRLHVLLWSGESYVASSDSFVSRARHIGLETNVRMAAKEITKQLEKHQEKISGRN